MDTFRNGITAHRGNPEKYPENTLPSFLSGAKSGADWIELDVIFSSDGELMVIHDESTGRTADKDLRVGQNTVKQLKELDFAFKFRKEHSETPVTRIPTLKEVFEALQNYETGISIQPKDNIELGLKAVETAILLAQSMKMENRIGFNDCHIEFMCKAKEVNSRVRVFYDVLYPEEKHIFDATKYGFESIICNASNITQSWISSVSATGLIPGVWTVNDIEEIKQFQSMGVKRFYTDRPETMITILK